MRSGANRSNCCSCRQSSLLLNTASRSILCRSLWERAVPRYGSSHSSKLSSSVLSASSGQFCCGKLVCSRCRRLRKICACFVQLSSCSPLFRSASISAVLTNSCCGLSGRWLMINAPFLLFAGDNPPLGPVPAVRLAPFAGWRWLEKSGSVANGSGCCRDQTEVADNSCYR